VETKGLLSHGKLRKNRWKQRHEDFGNCRTLLRAVTSGLRESQKMARLGEWRKAAMGGFISVQTFWTLWLFVHLILALGLLGAITHQAMAVALPVRKPITGIVSRFRAVPAAGYATAVCVLYVLTFCVGSFIYPQYRVAIRIPLEAEHYYKTGGFFDFKEHVATLGLVLLPAYWLFWKNVRSSEYDNARRGVTIVLAVIVWFLFIVGHVLNNTRGFAS
jgi:hypothetical protein